MTPIEALSELDGHADSLAFILDRLTVVLPYLKESIMSKRKSSSTTESKPAVKAQAAPQPAPVEPAPPAKAKKASKPVSEQVTPTAEELTAKHIEAASSEYLRKLSGQVMQELRKRKALAEGKTPPTQQHKAAKAAKTAAEKAEYLKRKAAYAQRPYGIQSADGKILKRRYETGAEATKAAAELTIQMKRQYIPVQLSA